MDQKQRYVKAYLQETEEHLRIIEEGLLDMEENPDDREGLHRVFRAIHTIKGSGAMFGFDHIAAFAHHVETLLERVRDGSIPVTRQLIDLILLARDRIKAMLYASDEDRREAEKNEQKIIKALHNLLAESPGEPSQAGANPVFQAQSSSGREDNEAVYRIRFSPHLNIMADGMDPLLLLNELRDMGECHVAAYTSAIPVLDELTAERCYFSWDIVLTTHSDLNAVKDVFIFVEDDSQVNIRMLPQTEIETKLQAIIPRLGDILLDKGDAAPEKLDEALNQRQKLGELLVSSGAVSSDRVESALREQNILRQRSSAIFTESIRVPSAKLDKMVNLVGELVITQARLTQIAGELGQVELNDPVEALEFLTSELRDCALNMRMMPIGTMFSKFRRHIRDLALELGKEVELVTTGAETELDKTIIERLSDPLVHVIRNSIDHGIQTPEERERKGKPRKGAIHLNAAHRGTKVVITISDDGEGLDADLIRKKAVDKGLIASGAELSLDETYALIFAPGFSTASRVTRVSGRGVGMDVVKREINRLGGEIQITSTKGEGATIRLTMLLTLAIIDGLLVEVGNRSFILPLEQVENCAELSPADLASAQGRNMIRVAGELAPFIRMRDFFGIPGAPPPIEQIALVKAEHLRAGIIVDEIIGNVQTVIKPLDRIYQHAEGVSGATIMGDGAVSLIVDVAGLIRCVRDEEENILAHQQPELNHV